MDGPSIIDDEIIADSEGEGDYSMPGQRDAVTNISSFTPHHAKDSSIVDASRSSSSRPRPRPRPAYKGAVGYQPDSFISNDSSNLLERTIPKPPSHNNNDDIDIPAFIVPSIADRAKMRQRDTQKTKLTIPPEVIEFTSDDDDVDELALTSSKKSQKSKAKSSSSKTRTKVKAKAKRDKKNGVPPPLPREESSQPSLPMGTSPVLPRIELAPAPPSTLPPSDYPQSTPSSINNMNDNEIEHPPIVIMPQLQSDVGSSSQLTSPCPSLKRKRSSEQDELEHEDADIRMATDVDKPDVSPPKETSSSKKLTAKAKKAKGKKFETEGSGVQDGDGEGMTKGKGKKVSKAKAKAKDRRKAKAKEPEEFYDEDDLFGDEPRRLNVRSTAVRGSKSPQGLVETAGPDKDDPSSPPPQKKQKPNDGNSSGLDSGKVSPSKPKGRRNVVISEDEEDDNGKMEEDVLAIKDNGRAKADKGKTKIHARLDPKDQESPPQPAEKSLEAPKENIDPKPATVAETPNKPAYTSISSRYSIAPRTKSTPMSELIRRVNVNAQPNSPFSPSPRSLPSTMGGTAYSPYLKSSRSMLSRIAPLHPNRRTPPPPPPPPPKKKKSKKELEMEERWEEEVIESVGGITEWAVLSDQERRDMRRAKREREMYGCED